MPLSIGILGAGRMGRVIAQNIASQPDLVVAYMWVRNDKQNQDLPVSQDQLNSDLVEIARQSDVLVDFSLPDACTSILDAAVRHKTPLVSGVSGLNEVQLAALDEAAAQIPVVYDRNMSVGVAILDELVRLAASSLGPSFAVDIHETHHIHKQDAPSGTALKLGEAIAQAKGQVFKDVAWYAPEAGTREPAEGDIRFEVERTGEVPGDHTVRFRSPAEELTLAHSVTTRNVFADGALRAARWAAGRKSGRYSMQDVLFGK